jgi:hypothetical protein
MVKKETTIPQCGELLYLRKLTVAYSTLILIYGIYPRMDLLG